MRLRGSTLGGISEERASGTAGELGRTQLGRASNTSREVDNTSREVVAMGTPKMRVRFRPTNQAVLGAMLSVPRAAVDMDRLRADLTISNPAYWQQKMSGNPITVEPTLELWTEQGKRVVVPRHYQPPYRKRARRVVDRRRNHKRWVSVSHKIKLRDKRQRRAFEAFTRDTEDKVVSLACGAGKTVVSLYSAAEGDRFPVLVVVHTQALMDQWRERIKEFYGLEEEEIGHIQGPTCRWKGLPIAVAMLHSLCLKKYPREMYGYFRLVVFDEVHKLGAQMFSQAAPLFPCERWGLSATVDREDRMDRLFKLHIGQVAYKNLKQPLKPKVFFMRTGLSFNTNRFMWRGRPNMGRIHTMIAEHDKRNAMILNCIRKSADAGRTILLLGERLTQLHWMTETLQAEGYDAALHVGSMKKEERAEALTHKIVLATQHLAKEGLDRPAFDTLVLVAPFGGIGRAQQSVGRILRLYDGKMKPKVFVFYDRIGIFEALANKMRRTFRAMDFQVFDHNMIGAT